MFFITNNVNSTNSDVSLESLLSINSANAQNSEAPCDKEGREVESSTYFVMSQNSTCTDKAGNICGQCTDCYISGTKLPNIPNVSSSCTIATCI
jgi:hypothetical protein